MPGKRETLEESSSLRTGSPRLGHPNHTEEKSKTCHTIVLHLGTMAHVWICGMRGFCQSSSGLSDDI